MTALRQLGDDAAKGLAAGAQLPHELDDSTLLGLTHLPSGCVDPISPSLATVMCVRCVAAMGADHAARMHEAEPFIASAAA